MSTIRLCENSEVCVIQAFIDDVWKEGHILSVNKDLLDFQYLQGNHYNFFIAEDNKKIIGILGFIPINLFDRSLSDKDYWLALWKTDDRSASPGVGIGLLRALYKTFTPDSVGVLGINSEVRKLYEIMGFQTGKLSHYYIANPKCEKFHIAENMQIIYELETENTSFREIKDINHINGLSAGYYPNKSKHYIVHRYDKHPFYKYLFWGAYNGKELVAVFVLRLQKTKDSQCLRIIDIIGKHKKISLTRNDFLLLMKSFNVEYVDCLNFGIPENEFYAWGFIKKGGNTIVPNFFEPFLKENIDVQFAYKTNYPEYVFFKGDGDQDRPNIL
jgi:hypothetical protein